jgi:hypothetical protein
LLNVSYPTSGAKADVDVRVASTQGFSGRPLTRQANSRDQVVCVEATTIAEIAGLLLRNEALTFSRQKCCPNS